MLIKEGVVRGPTIGATLDGHIDYAQDELRLRGTFVPLYGLNNMFGKIPLVGLFLGGGSNEGLVGINYEAIRAAGFAAHQHQSDLGGGAGAAAENDTRAGIGGPELHSADALISAA